MDMTECRTGFIQAVKVINTKFTQKRSSLDTIIGEADHQINVGVPDAGRLTYLINKLRRENAAKYRKYEPALLFVKENWWRITENALVTGNPLVYQNIVYTMQPADGSDDAPELKVLEDGKESLIFKQGKAQFELDEAQRPNKVKFFRRGVHVRIEDRSRRSTTSKDAQYCRNLTAQTVRIVRALIREGTLNNLMGGHHSHNGTVTQRVQSKWGGVVNRNVRQPVPGFLTATSPKAMAARVETMRVQLGASQPGRHVKLAGMGLAPRLVGGAVCAMLAHVTAGVLTTIATQTKVLIVFDAMYDHSYVVICRGDSTWYQVDPWVRIPRVVPWKDCWFPREDVMNWFEIYVKHHVTAPYGVIFTQQQIQSAMAINSALTGAMDSTYGHGSNVVDRRPEDQRNVRNPLEARYHPQIAGPLDWGRGIYTEV